MKKNLFIILIAGFIGSHSLMAQFDSQLSNYWAAINYFNPAYAGQTENMEITLLSRLQWMGIDDAPRTTIVAAQMPYQFMEKTHGLGASMYNDRSGLLSVSVFSGQYAWKKKWVREILAPACKLDTSTSLLTEAK
jgi:type IX secretion system PorP/SprF family membrane protein